MLAEAEKGGMTTEVLGFLIILGMLVVVVLNRQIWQRREPSAPADEMEEATRRLRREMEQSADEIISRMGAQIDHLEHLVAEADKRARRLERQLEEMKDASARHEEEAPRRYRNGFEKMLAASMATEELSEPPLRRTQPTAAPSRRQPPVAWAEPEAIPADLAEQSSPPVELAPSLEVVVAPSVADVVDLPLDPEEGEMTWTAADDRNEPETVYPGPAAYAAYPASPERAEDFAPQTYEAAPAYPPASPAYEPDASPYTTAESAVFSPGYEETPAAYATPEPEAPAAVYEASSAAYPAAEPEADETASYPASYAPTGDGETAVESRITGILPVAETPVASMGPDTTAMSALFPMTETTREEEKAMTLETAVGPPLADDEAWDGESMTAEMLAGIAAPSGAIAAEDDTVQAEESVWTEEDEEDAIESQQVAEVLQVSRTSASSRAREMLEQGRSADEVSRELHMGRNAIELIAQMVRRKQAAPH